MLWVVSMYRYNKSNYSYQYLYELEKPVKKPKVKRYNNALHFATWLFGMLLIFLNRENKTAIEANTAAAKAPDRYDLISKIFHWFFAISIIYATVSGYSLLYITNHTIHDFIAHFNVSLATILIILFPARIIWTYFREEPSPVKGASKSQHKVAHLAHALIYISISSVLITGYLMIPEGYDFFGLLTIVTPFHQGEATEFFFIMHRISCAVLALLIFVHVGAVVQHYVFHHVNILKRMI